MKQKNKETNLYIGEKIKYYRRDVGLTQTDIGNIINTTYQQVQKYEKGISNVPIANLLKIVNHLNKDIKDFLPNNEGKKTKPISNELFKVFKNLKKLKPESLPIISNLIKGFKITD